MIVIHGFMGSGNNFRNVCKSEQITKFANCYLLDCRNHGISEHKPTMSFSEMADDVHYFI